MIDFELTGDKPLMQRMEDAKHMRHLLPHFKVAIFGVERVMKRYPTPPRGSGYRRTGLYGQSWQSQFGAGFGHVFAQTVSNRRGAPYIGNQEMQAGIHRGRWPLDVEAIAAVTPRLTADIGATIVRRMAE